MFLPLLKEKMLRLLSDRPTMSSPGTETLETLNKPILIVVCKSSQFNYLHAKSLGYFRSTEYFVGNSSTQDIWTWNGLSGNRTANETMNYIYKSNLENIQFRLKNDNITNRFLLPHGKCKILEDKPKRRFIVDLHGKGDPTKYFIFVVDPASYIHKIFVA